MKRIDLVLLFLVIFLTFFGLFIVYDASSYVAFRDFSDKYRYVKDQSVWMILGTLGMIGFYLFDYRRLYNFALPLLVIALILLILVFIPGIGLFLLGARRWLHFGPIVIQPAEFVKLALAIYLSAWFSHKEKKRSLAFLLLIGLMLSLVMLEPDMGTAAIILFEALSVYFVSGGSIALLLSFFPIIGLLGFLLIKTSPYRAARLSAFLNIDRSIEASSYHVKQILIALGMGGLTGVGFGNSLQKYAYLPESTTDSIFAIVAEEIGFIGSTIIIILFAIIIWRGFLIAGRAKDTFGKLLAVSITSFLAMQMLINLGAQTALIPLTGVPLPFISYGGSALVIDLCSIGILLSIYKQSTVSNSVIKKL